VSYFSLTIPGDFEDAFLYMGRLIFTTSEMDLMSADLRDSLANGGAGRFSSLLQFFFLRNDQLNSQIAQSLMAEPGIRRAVAREAGDRIVALPNTNALTRSSRLNGAVLDMQIYNRRLYVSTTEGLYHFDLDFEASAVDVLDSRRRFAARCLATSIKSGTAVASCGDNGLRVAFDEFEWSPIDRNHRFIDYSSASRRATWMTYSLVNYPSVSSLEFLRGHREPVADPMPGGATYVLSDFERDDDAIAPLEDEFDGLDFVFNNQAMFFTQRKSGAYNFSRHTYSARYRRFGFGEKGIRKGRMPPALSAHGLGDGIVVEAFDSVTLIAADRAERLFDGQAVKVRTFPSSRHHMNLVVVISDDALHLISPIPPPAAT
jgi:hypothetical protein